MARRTVVTTVSLLHDRLWGSNSPQFLPPSGAPLIFGSQRVLDWAYFCRGVVKGSETSIPEKPQAGVLSRGISPWFYPPTDSRSLQSRRIYVRAYPVVDARPPNPHQGGPSGYLSCLAHVYQDA